jgi:hypothetical protein
LAEDGTWMIVEPKAEDELEANVSLVARLHYCRTTLIGTPATMA